MNSEQIGDYLNRGWQSYLQGDYQAAIQNYRHVLELNPKDGEIYCKLAEAYIYNEKVEAAISALENALELRPDFASAYWRVGNALQQCGRTELAIWAYTQALDIRPESAIAWANLGSVYYQCRRFEEAIQCYQKSLELQPDWAVVYWMLGNALFQTGKLPEAIARYQEAIRRQPNRPQFYLKLAEALSKVHRKEEAIANYKKALTLDPENRETLLEKIRELEPQIDVDLSDSLSFVEESDERFEERGVDLSEQVFEGELRSHPETAESETLVPAHTEQFFVERPEAVSPPKPELSPAEMLQKQAELYLSQGNWEGAIAACREALKLRPDLLLAFVTLGNALHFQGKVDAAIRAYSQALKIDPNFAEVYANLATMYLHRGRMEEAIAHYQKSVELKPDLAAVHWNLGRVYQQLGRAEEAIAAWNEALKLKPDLVAAEFNFEFGNSLARRGQLEEAIASYKRAIAGKPNWAEPYGNIGCLLSQQNRFEEALEQFQNAIALNSELPELYLHTARILTKLGRHRDAIAAYQNLIRLQPDYADGYANMANMYATIGEITPAIANYKKALELQPKWAEVYCRLAHIQKQDSPQEAVANLEKAIELKPDFGEAHQQLCDLLSHSTNLGKARKAADRYWETCSNTIPIFCAIAYIFAYTQSGACEEALEKLRELERICRDRIGTLTDMEIRLIYEILLFTVPHLRDDLEANAKFYRLICQSYYKGPVAEPPNIYAEPRSPLRIGFLSKHFRRHSVGWCSEAVIRELTTITPQVNLYVSGRLHPDEVTERFQKMTAKFYQPKHYPNGFASAEELSREIRGDRVDVLVDLDSITIPVNVQVLHRSPAPVCVTWLGFDAPYLSPNHYFICDENSHPPGIERHYFERLVRLPETSVAIDGLPTRPVDCRSVRQQLNISPNAIVFLCVAPGRKTNWEMILAQVKILRSVPESLLIRKGQGDPQLLRKMYNDACEAEGVDMNRLIFIGLTKTEEEHRAIYKVADVMLDSYPYNGGTHNLEALWSELPVVTRSGRQYLSRMGYAFLKAVNLDVGWAWSWEEYAQLGIEFGCNAALRRQIRDRLAIAKQPDTLAPLWNPKQLANQMYRVLEELRYRQTP
ncbi:MAG: tetratricopeptide repeat protein [Limnospira sp.]